MLTENPKEEPLAHSDNTMTLAELHSTMTVQTITNEAVGGSGVTTVETVQIIRNKVDAGPAAVDAVLETPNIKDFLEKHCVGGVYQATESTPSPASVRL